jgi:hypothetical protein
MKLSRTATTVLFFIGTILALTAMVFLYVYLVGGGGTGRRYLPFYYPLAGLLLVLVAAFARGRRNGDS